MGKILHIKAGARLSLQLHDEKQESWFLMNGRAKVLWDDKQGSMVETELQPGHGYSTGVGQRAPSGRSHRLRCRRGLHSRTRHDVATRR